MSLLFPAAALAAPVPLDELEREVSRLERDYAARQAALQQEMEARLSALEAQIAALRAGPAEDRQTVVDRNADPAPPPDEEGLFDIAGDFRLRYEHTTAHAGIPSRDRGVVRARLGAAYAINDRFTLGGRITTGDPDDPNSADVTMGDFVNDLTVSLDQVYAQYEAGNSSIVGGKFANPFARTELVWDGDVNPYGIAGRQRLYEGSVGTVTMTGIYSIVDEQLDAGDSNMAGAQVSIDVEPATDWQFGFDVAYYDYSIGSLLDADAGDTRGNNLTPDGTAYLSDFDLLDVILSTDYVGLSNGWPLRIAADYVRNLGAAVPEDSAWSLGFVLGKLVDIGDWRIGYRYSVAETDAVLAAFSNDNTTYATNYREHAVQVDYLLLPGTFLNATGYVYRRDDFALANQPGDNDWVSRLRLNLYFQF